MEEVKLPLEDQLAMAYAGRQEEKALRESDRRCVSLLLHNYGVFWLGRDCTGKVP